AVARGRFVGEVHVAAEAVPDEAPAVELAVVGEEAGARELRQDPVDDRVVPRPPHGEDPHLAAVCEGGGGKRAGGRGGGAGGGAGGAGGAGGRRRPKPAISPVGRGRSRCARACRSASG